MADCEGISTTISFRVCTYLQGNSIKKAIDDVKTILNYFLKNNKGTGVVFDIDDTLIESEMGNGIKETKELANFCKKNNIPTFFITARLKEKDVIRDTLRELRDQGIEVEEENLKLSPASWRESFTKISQWKRNVREKISKSLGHKITFTLGDQWGDIFSINENEYKTLNKEFYGVQKKKPIAILVRGDDVSLWGVKLLSTVEKKEL